MTEAKEAAATHVGVRLREAREEQGLSLDDVGRQTRVPVRHLVQIEEGRLTGLPAAPYSAGFVKSYARVVGLDPVALSQQFRMEFDQAQGGVPRIAYEPYEPADPNRLPPRLLAMVALVIAIVLVAGYAIWRSGLVSGENADTRARLAAEGTDTPGGAPAPTAVAPPVGAPVAVPAPAPAPVGGPVVLVAKQPVWVKISERNGATLFMGEIAQGKSWPVPANAVDPVIRTGRPEAIEVQVGGRAVAPLGEAARTVSNVSLKAESLLSRGAGGAPAAAAGSAPATPTPAAARRTPNGAPVPIIDRPATALPPAFANTNGG